MFLQNAIKCFFVCATNSRNIILLFPKKVISHDPLQKLYANLARTCKNKFYENKIKLDWLTLFKKFYYGITDSGGGKKLPPVSDRVKGTVRIDQISNGNISRTRL